MPIFIENLMRNLDKINQEKYDLIIIGGGINGAGVARDAALRGLKTILLEKDDFAGGTSSWSTRLIHGGLRYLEYFEFSLVRDALKEREILLRNAPHLVHPLLLTIPIYKDRSRPYWKILAGMILYDIFSFDKSLPNHRMLPKSKFTQLFRSIDRENLQGGSQYYDGQVVYAERLCWENVLCAQQAGATVLNYTEVTQLHLKANNSSPSRITAITCRDVLTGQDFQVQFSDNAVVVNTAGPWVDSVCQLGMRNGNHEMIGKTKKIGATKGSHIIVAPFPGAPDSSLYVEAKSDGRPFFIIPWLGMYLIGTTDFRYHGNLDKIKADDEEIDYLLKETNLIIPAANLSRSDIKFTYSGVRPLPNEEGKKAGSVTRRHIIFDHKSEGVTNLISLIGGKLTTYRSVAAELVNVAYEKMGKTASACLTDEKPLPGCIFDNDIRIASAIDEYKDHLRKDSIKHLFSLYGAMALDVLKLVREYPELGQQINPQLPDIKAQIVYAVGFELAENIIDIMRRRTVLAIHGNYGFDFLPVVTEVLQKYCGWSQEKCDRSVKNYQEYMENNCIPNYQLS